MFATTSIAAETNFHATGNKHDYVIVNVNENDVTNIKFKPEGTFTQISFELLAKYQVDVIADFYSLEGSALSSQSYLANVKNSNYEIHHLSISLQQKMFFKDITLNDGEVLLNIVISVPEENKVLIISEPINEIEVQEIIENSKELSLDDNDPLFMELHGTEFWWNQLKRNEKLNHEYTIATEDPFSLSYSENQLGLMSTPTVIGDPNNELPSFMSPNVFKYTGVHYSYVYDLNGDLVRGYIRDTFESYDGKLISLIALYNFNYNVAGEVGGPSNSRVAYTAIQRHHNLMGIYDPSTNTVNITWANNNSTYLVTTKPRIAMRIMGYGTEGYFTRYNFGQYSGGSQPGPWMSIFTTLVGLRYPKLGLPITGAYLIDDVLTQLQGQNYDSAVKAYEITPHVNNNYTKWIGSKLQASLYQRYSALDAKAFVSEYSSGFNSEIQYQFEVEFTDHNSIKQTIKFTYSNSLD